MCNESLLLANTWWLAAGYKQLCLQISGSTELAVDHHVVCHPHPPNWSNTTLNNSHCLPHCLPYLDKMAHHAAHQGLPQRLADELDAARKAAAEACTAFLADTTLSMHTVMCAFNELQRSAAAAAVSNSGAPVDATFAVLPDVRRDARATTAARLVELHDRSPQELWALIVLDVKLEMSGRWPTCQGCDWPTD